MESAGLTVGDTPAARAQRQSSASKHAKLELKTVPINPALKEVEKDPRSMTVGDLEARNDPKRLLPSYKWETPEEEKFSKVLAHYKNGDINTRINGSLYGAFSAAYNLHEDVTLVPDDVWMTILFQFSKYVNAHAEELRSKFVSFEGKKFLEVTTHNELEESEWKEFFDMMTVAIKANTKDGITEVMEANFTTTGFVERMVSTAAVMDSFQKYFDYGRCIPMCGIRNVNFGGTLDDWYLIVDKLNKLAAYDVDGKWANYCKTLNPILEQFIATYRGEVDTKFWDKVMNQTHGSLGSGGTTYVSGWILAFYGQSGKIDVGDLDSSHVLDVPVRLDNKITGVVKTVKVRATFAGVVKEGDSYRPQLSMIVCSQ